MRIRATVAAVTGALALSALAVPAAHADGKAHGFSVPSFAKSFAKATATPADESEGDTTISSVVVNAGKPVVLGTTSKLTVKVTLTASDPSGIHSADAFLYHGTYPDNYNGAQASTKTCGPQKTAKYTCTLSYHFTSQNTVYSNGLAGTWKVAAYAVGKDGDFVEKDAIKTFKVLRTSKLTVNAAPEPVKKGATITVTGSLTRADWNTSKYAGYGSQKVALQFRKAGTTNYVNVKGITSSKTGALKTTVKAAQDGYYRFTYAGSPNAATVSATGDYVDVK
ncbi:calcium-binding protein [Streptomyces sp. NPDC058691]|uniref:calcium-binding protein n=1 Tax=Streptomyces sp. NPDC058691 TaxID=3346601 RepID=UPI003650B400